MPPKLILVEGINGSGKSTYVESLKQLYKNNRVPVILYRNGKPHPADMTRQALLNENEYIDFLNYCISIWKGSKKTISIEELISRIEMQVIREAIGIVLAYTKIDFPESSFQAAYEIVRNKELYDGFSTFDIFADIHKKRWRMFSQNNCMDNAIHIFEGVLMQFPLMELIGFYGMGKQECLIYIQQLLDTSISMNPEIHYLDVPDVRATISYVAEERISANQSKWIDSYVIWFEHTYYSKINNIGGFDGVIQFCHKLKDIEDYILAHLDIPTRIIHR